MNGGRKLWIDQKRPTTTEAPHYPATDYKVAGGNEAAIRVLFGASARNDPEFADVIEQLLDDVAGVISQLIDIEGTAEHRRVLAHALIGIAEATSRDTLTDDGSALDAEELAHWVSELAWFGLRGIRSEARAAARPSGPADRGP